jgi:hemolysin III
MRIQTPFEEKLNTITHGFGALLGVVGLIFLLQKITKTDTLHIASIVVYGITIIFLFTASTLYHYSTKEKRKHYFRILDHIGIYILIAGTYTPVVLISLSHSLGWTLFYTVWGIAAFGVVLKLFFTGKFNVFSTVLYLVMGWLVVFDFSALAIAIGDNGMLWLAAGGFFYTVGIIFYVIEKIPFNHVIWHVFVLLGAISHFIMVFFYVV